MSNSCPTRRSSDLLGRDEPGRHRLEHQAGRGRQYRVDQEHRAAAAKRARNHALVTVGAALEEAIERPEQPAEQAVDQARRTILRRVVRLRSEEHTSEPQSLMSISYAVFRLKK